jgi:hypothetical protein
MTTNMTAADGKALDTYNVHLYRVMCLYYPGIRATSPEAAAQLAAEKPSSEAERIDGDCDGENLSALVDVAGDDWYLMSQMISLDPIIAAAQELLSALEIIANDYPSLLEEKMRPQDAAAIRTAIANARHTAA